MPVKVRKKEVVIEKPVIKESPPKWELSRDDYLELLEMVDKNAKAILILRKDTDRLKLRMGI